MKKYILILFALIFSAVLLFFCTSTYNSYVDVDKSKFQEKIDTINIISEKGLIEEYFIFSGYDYIPKCILSIKNISGIYEISCEYWSRSDSVDRNKIMIGTNKELKDIYYIHSTRKCRKGRGFTF